jgi:imidazole glycerol phosphate synthase glutamine amidotransferase subunit
MKVGIFSHPASGNIRSICNAVNFLGYDARTVTQIDDVDCLIIPGVGNYLSGSIALSDYYKLIYEFSLEKPILGICVGMQLLTQKGFEYGESPGLNLIDGICVKMNTKLRLPNIGWRLVTQTKPSKLLEGIQDPLFYFMHSYEVINTHSCVAVSNYQTYEFAAIIESNKLFGVQFHPEKSREAGLQLINNFLGICGE